MEPREIVRVSILVTFGALAVAIAAWLLSFGLGGTSGSPFGPFVALGGILLLLLGLFLLGGAGLDAVWQKLAAIRNVRKP